jgi:serine phosphatase RsbU (regulator of sigma subunit)
MHFWVHRCLPESDVADANLRRPMAGTDDVVAPIQRILDVLPGSVALLVPVFDAAGEVIDWRTAAISPDSVDIAGRRSGQILGRRALDLYPATAGTEAWRAYIRTFATGSPSVVDLTYTQRAAGLPKEARYTLRIHRHHPGIMVTWVRKDLDERAAARLADTERMGNLGWGVWRADGSIEWSDHLYRIMDRDVAHGPMSFTEFLTYVHPADRAHVAERFASLKSNDRCDLEFRIVLAAGVRHVRARTEMTRDATGLPLETFSLIQDTTDIHRSRERLLRTTRELLAKEHRLAEEHRLAVRLQRVVLPVPDRPLDLPGMQVEVRHLPAEEASLLGGDWYHATTQPDGSLLLAIGDVAGHGLPAAPVMAQLRYALTGLAAAGTGPAAALRALNTILCDHVTEHTLATAVVAHYQPHSRELTWAQAGHPPCLLVRDTRTHLLDRPDGLVLGADRDADYATAHTVLRPGDLLLMYTDGLIERPDRTLDGAIADLAEIVAAAAAHAPGVDQVSAILHAIGRANPDDDSCILAAQTNERLDT